jgi:hypothetical protein
MNPNHSRTRRLRLSLAALVLGTTLFLSPRLAERVYAQTSDSTCTVNCKLGSCSGTGSCTCSCGFWTGTPTCSCQSQGGTAPTPPVNET